MKEDFLFLKQKAEKFYSIAASSFLNKDYDMAALHLEQSVQLYLKFTIGWIMGDFPRTHNIIKLMDGVINSTGNQALKFLKESNENIITEIEKSYFESRYFDTPFSQSQIQEMFDFHKEMLSILDKLWN
jgi:HEPN domain-containing protein